MSQSLIPDQADIGALVDRDLLVGMLRELVRRPSENPPGDETAVAGAVDRLCRQLGLDVSIVQAEAGRPSVLARWGTGARPRVIYCSHLDVVPAGERALWSVDPYAAEVAGGRLYGRGACDAKGSLVAALEAVRVLKAGGLDIDGTLDLMFVCDEETMGFKGAGYLLDQGMLACDAAIVGEPTSLRVVIAQRGAHWVRITTRGLAAHGSAPERGRNAIRHMAEIVGHLEETLPDLSHPTLGGPSISVGTIRGGEKVNIVPAYCVLQVDRRTVPPETKEEVIGQIEEAIARARLRFPDLDAAVEIELWGDSFEVAPSARVVRDVAGAVSEVVGAPAELIGFRGASDARFFAEAGTEVVVCGPGEIALAHTANESIDLVELERAVVVYALAFARLLGRS